MRKIGLDVGKHVADGLTLSSVRSSDTRAPYVALEWWAFERAVAMLGDGVVGAGQDASSRLFAPSTSLVGPSSASRSSRGAENRTRWLHRCVASAKVRSPAQNPNHSEGHSSVPSRTRGLHSIA